jgi:hypothetical protein
MTLIAHPDFPGHLLWFRFVESGKRSLALTGYGGLSYRKIGLASYDFDENGGIIAWLADVNDPSQHIMFLFDGLFTSMHRLRAPAIITDGEYWCPLMKTKSRKYRSFPNYSGRVMLTAVDRIVIVAAIKEHIDNEFEDGL